MRNMDFLQKVPVSFSGPNKPPPPSTARHFSDSFTRSWCRHCPPARPSRSPGPGKHGGPHGYGLALSGFQLFRFSSSPFPSVWLGLSYGSGPRSPSPFILLFFSFFSLSPHSSFRFQLSALRSPPPPSSLARASLTAQVSSLPWDPYASASSLLRPLRPSLTLLPFVKNLCRPRAPARC